MKKLTFFLLIITLSISVAGCRGKDNINQQGQQVNAPVAETERAQSFLLGLQVGDKAKMYTAANLTVEIVNDSREKLVHPSQYKQNAQQKADSEHALRISGEIEFLSKRMNKIITKSATIQITKSVATQTTIDHTIKLVYANKDDAPADKTGKQVKEMTLHLLQVTRVIENRKIHEFSFNSRDFDKMTERDFEVVAYF